MVWYKLFTQESLKLTNCSINPYNNTGECLHVAVAMQLKFTLFFLVMAYSCLSVEVQSYHGLLWY